MDILRTESTITVKMTKEEVKLVVEAVDRAISMIDHHVGKHIIGRQALMRELRPISIEFAKILRRM